MCPFSLMFFKFSYHFLLDLILFFCQVLNCFIQDFNMDLQLLLHLDMISYFSFIFLHLLLMLNRSEIDRHNSALWHLVYISFFCSIIEIVTSTWIYLFHKIKISLFLNIWFYRDDIVFLHTHQDFNRSLDVLQDGKAIKSNKFIIFYLKILVFDSIKFFGCSHFDLQIQIYNCFTNLLAYFRRHDYRLSFTNLMLVLIRQWNELICIYDIIMRYKVKVLKVNIIDIPSIFL